MRIDESAIFSMSMQQAFRGDVPPLSEREIEHLLDHFDLAIAEGERQDVGEALARAYEEVVRGVRLIRTDAVTKGQSDTGRTQQHQKLTTRTASEVEGVVNIFDALTAALETLSPAARRLIDEELRNMFPPPKHRRRLRKLWDQAFGPLHLIATAADRASIETKPGRYEAPLHQMVRTLAEIWKHCTGEEPHRSYDGQGTASWGQNGESGPFLDLARELACLADRALEKEGLRVGSRSLSRIVRTALENRA